MGENNWTSNDDVLRDLRSVSDFCDNSVRLQSHKPSVHARKARAKPSIYDDAGIEGTELSKNRYKGRGFSFHSRTITPGIEHSQLREIREVSGYGFSNKLIECGLRNELEACNSITTPTVMPNICLGSQSSPSTSSTSSPIDDVVKSSRNNTKDAPPPLYDMLKSTKPRKSNKKRTANETTAPSRVADVFKKDPSKAYDLGSHRDFPQL